MRIDTWRFTTLSLAIVLAPAFAGSPRAEQPLVPIQPARIAMEVPGPPPGTAMTKAYVQMVARMAYVWGYPLVNAHNRRAGIAMTPYPGLNGGVVPVAPVGEVAMLTDTIQPQQNFIACPNQDVVSGSGFFALDGEPIVFQVPEFGGRFWVYAFYNARTDEFGTIGKPYDTKPGFYMLVGPTWQGHAPEGVVGVLRSTTELAYVAPRVFKDDTPEDTKAVQSVVGQIMFYPLSRFDGKMKSTDWSKIPNLPAPPSGKGEMKWVDPEKFFDRLPSIMAMVPPLAGEEIVYNWIKSAWDAAAKDPELKSAMTEAFVAADREIIEPLLQWRFNGGPAGNGWNSPVNNAQWGTDYLNRAATAKSNMYENRPDETKYLYRDLDSRGEQLSGANGYSITFPKGKLPPVKGFWSIALYDGRHFFHPNALNRYALGTKSKSLKFNEDGSLTLYAGAQSPGKDKETNWLPAPEGSFSLYLRCYWPEQAILQGSWQPPNVDMSR